MNQKDEGTLKMLRALLNDERNPGVIALIDGDDRLDDLVAAAKRTDPREPTSYPNMNAYTAALTAFKPILERAWARYDALLWKWVGAQIAELQSVFLPIASHPNASVRARFNSAFGALYDSATEIMDRLGKLDPSSADPIRVRKGIPKAWDVVKGLRAAGEQIDRAGGLKPSNALKDKPSLANHLEKLDMLGSVEVIASMSQEQLAKRLGDPGLGEILYIALLSKVKREEYLRAKRATAEPPPPEQITTLAFVMPRTVPEIIAALDPFVKPSPNGSVDTLVWTPCAESDVDGMHASEWAKLTDAALKKVSAPHPVCVLVRATFPRPLNPKTLDRALADAARAEKEGAGIKKTGK